MVKIEEVIDSQPDEFRYVAEHQPTALVDPRCYLLGLEGHIITYNYSFFAAATIPQFSFLGK